MSKYFSIFGKSEVIIKVIDGTDTVEFDRLCLNRKKSLSELQSTQIALISYSSSQSWLQTVARCPLDVLRAYAQRHNHDVFIFTEKNATIPVWNHIRNSNPKCKKISLILSVLALQRHEWVLWIDSDAFIYARTRDTTVLNYLRQFHNSRFDIIVMQDSFGVNTGVWLLRNTNWTVAFLSKIVTQHLTLDRCLLDGMPEGNALREIIKAEIESLHIRPQASVLCKLYLHRCRRKQSRETIVNNVRVSFQRGDCGTNDLQVYWKKIASSGSDRYILRGWNDDKISAHTHQQLLDPVTIHNPASCKYEPVCSAAFLKLCGETKQRFLA